jgi:NAD(P)-dependent dehydrogenase (short-subunit alcohol dehydrogenase family)
VDRFIGKVAIVTGGGSGIGRATALLLASEGAAVTVADIAEPAATAVVAEIEAAGGKARAQVTDVADADAVAAMLADTAQAFGGLDILHNNAAALDQNRVDQDVVTMDLDTWDRVMKVNLTGPMLGCRFAIPHMLERGRGSIVNIASQAGKRGNRFIAHYNASKAGVISLTQTAALEAAPHVRVNCVCPGIINTDLQEQEYEVVSRLTGKSRDEIKSEWISSMPLGQFQEVEDVAEAVLFLASDDARQTTGEALNVSGGMVME